MIPLDVWPHIVTQAEQLIRQSEMAKHREKILQDVLDAIAPDESRPVTHEEIQKALDDLRRNNPALRKFLDETEASIAARTSSIFDRLRRFERPAPLDPAPGPTVEERTTWCATLQNGTLLSKEGSLLKILEFLLKHVGEREAWYAVVLGKSGIVTVERKLAFVDKVGRVEEMVKLALEKTDSVSVDRGVRISDNASGTNILVHWKIRPGVDRCLRAPNLHVATRIALLLTLEPWLKTWRVEID